ncbi:hypothetical protein SNO03_23950, partial [Klebsiella pneumoniae]
MKWMTKYIFRGWGAVLTWGIACGASAELPAWLSTSDIPTLAEPMNVSPPNDIGLTRTTLDVFTCSAGNMSANIIRTLWRGTVGNDSNLLIVFYVQIVPDDFVMQLHR